MTPTPPGDPVEAQAFCDVIERYLATQDSTKAHFCRSALANIRLALQTVQPSPLVPGPTREFWITEDAKTGQLMQTSWKKPSDWITGNPSFKVSRWVEAPEPEALPKEGA